MKRVGRISVFLHSTDRVETRISDDRRDALSRLADRIESRPRFGINIVRIHDVVRALGFVDAAEYNEFVLNDSAGRSGAPRWHIGQAIPFHFFLFYIDAFEGAQRHSLFIASADDEYFLSGVERPTKSPRGRHVRHFVALQRRRRRRGSHRGTI